MRVYLTKNFYKQLLPQGGFSERSTLLCAETGFCDGRFCLASSFMCSFCSLCFICDKTVDSFKQSFLFYLSRDFYSISISISILALCQGQEVWRNWIYFLSRFLTFTCSLTEVTELNFHALHCCHCWSDDMSWYRQLLLPHLNFSAHHWHLTLTAFI